MKGDFCVGQYKKCWGFLKESRWYVVFALGVFGLMFLVGFAYPIFFREEIFGFIAEMIGNLEGKSVVELIGFIFLNNLWVSFIAIVSGIAIGVFPFLIVVVNGYLVGFVAREAAMAEGIVVLWQLVPHGIFELPAILLSIGIGLRLGSQVVGRVVERVSGRASPVVASRSIGYVFREGMRFFVFVVFPLLLIAGIIEGILIALMG